MDPRRRMYRIEIGTDPAGRVLNRRIQVTSMVTGKTSEQVRGGDLRERAGASRLGLLESRRSMARLLLGLATRVSRYRSVFQRGDEVGDDGRELGLDLRLAQLLDLPLAQSASCARWN